MYKNLKDKTQTNQTKNQTKMTKKPYKQTKSNKTNFIQIPASPLSFLAVYFGWTVTKEVSVWKVDI